VDLGRFVAGAGDDFQVAGHELGHDIGRRDLFRAAQRVAVVVDEHAFRCAATGADVAGGVESGLGRGQGAEAARQFRVVDDRHRVFVLAGEARIIAREDRCVGLEAGGRGRFADRIVAVGDRALAGYVLGAEVDRLQGAALKVVAHVETATILGLVAEAGGQFVAARRGHGARIARREVHPRSQVGDGEVVVIGDQRRRAVGGRAAARRTRRDRGRPQFEVVRAIVAAVRIEQAGGEVPVAGRLLHAEFEGRQAGVLGIGFVPQAVRHIGDQGLVETGARRDVTRLERAAAVGRAGAFVAHHAFADDLIEAGVLRREVVGVGGVQIVGRVVVGAIVERQGAAGQLGAAARHADIEAGQDEVIDRIHARRDVAVGVDIGQGVGAVAAGRFHHAA